MAGQFKPQRLLVLLLMIPWIIGDLSVCADVATLNDATFMDKVKEKDTLWFINFCVPWCKHCNRMKSLWEELDKAVDMEDGVEIAQVDCTISKPLCGKLEIRSYPTLKLFYDGEDYKKYSGHQDLAALKKFAVEEALELTKGDTEEEL